MSLEKQTILVVDDTPANLDVMKNILAQDYNLKLSTNGKLALKIMEQHQPDLVLLDVMMPEMDGYEVCRQIKANPLLHKIPVIFVTAMTDIDDEKKGFELGAVDYITKPVHPALVLSRVKTHLTLANQQRATEAEVQLRTQELQQSQRDAIYMLGKAGHYNDNDTGVHIWRMAEYSALLAMKLGWSHDDAIMMKQAAAMHDTGKIGIPDAILKAPRALTDEEWDVMRSHSQLGYEILSFSQTPLFQLAAEIALTHHEKWDGSGYPAGLSEKSIPESGRIVAIADVFDALTMKRPYKEAWPIEKALTILKQDAGTHFDPDLVNLFIDSIDEIMEIKQKWDTGDEQTLLHS
jgi:putative two-component system response regulator